MYASDNVGYIVTPSRQDSSWPLVDFCIGSRCLAIMVTACIVPNAALPQLGDQHADAWAASVDGAARGV
jgi:hypothetical protein